MVKFSKKAVSMIHEKQTEKKVWIDGSLVDVADAKVSVFDHGLLYGDGVFEGIRSYSGKIFELNAHMERLYTSARVIRLEIPYDIDQLKQATRQTCDANNVKDGYIRLVVTRGCGTLGINPFLCKRPTVFIIADNIQLYPEQLYENGLKVISASTIRNHPLAIPPQVKSLNYLNNIIAKIEAVDNDMLEAIMYNSQGFVAEATGDNVFIVKNGQIFVPPVQAGSLDGITRAVVLKLAKKRGIETIERNLTKFDLYASDEMFLTGTAAEVIGVVEMDRRPIGNGTPGPITKQLRSDFFEYAHANGE